LMLPGKANSYFAKFNLNLKSPIFDDFNGL